MAIFNSLFFDDKSSLDFGVYITGSAVYNAPVRQVNLITVPGRNGALAVDQGSFNNIDVTYPAGCFAESSSDFARKISDFRNFLCTKYSYKKLTDTYNPDEYRLALYSVGLEVNPVQYNRAGQFEITFTCKPQRFLLSGGDPVTLTNDGEIINPTAFDSKPLLVVTGAGTLNIGSHVLTIAAGSSPASQVIYVDCDTQEAWELVNGAMIARNDYIQNAGELFPTLSAGSNQILLGTGISSVEITPRWWKI